MEFIIRVHAAPGLAGNERDLLLFFTRTPPIRSLSSIMSIDSGWDSSICWLLLLQLERDVLVVRLQGKALLQSCCKCRVRVDSTCKRNSRQTTDVGSALGRLMRRNAHARRTNLAAAGFFLIQYPAMAMMRGQVGFLFHASPYSWFGFVYQQQAVIIYQLGLALLILSSKRSSWWSTCWWSPPSQVLMYQGVVAHCIFLLRLKV